MFPIKGFPSARLTLVAGGHQSLSHLYKGYHPGQQPVEQGYVLHKVSTFRKTSVCRCVSLCMDRSTNHFHPVSSLLKLEFKTQVCMQMLYLKIGP